MKRMDLRWQRVFWLATILIMWVLSLVIVESAARRNRMGYQINRLQSVQNTLDERNLRLRCEIASLHDLQQAQELAEAGNYTHLTPENLETVTEERTL